MPVWHPPTPTEIMQSIRKRSGELDTASLTVRRLGRRYAEARHAYRMADARVLLRFIGQGTVRERDARAALASADEHLEMEIADQELRAARDHIANLRAQLSADQSIGAWLRTEVTLPSQTWGA